MKKAFILILMVLLAGSSAALKLIEPVEKTVENNSVSELGFIQQGEVLELVFSNSAGEEKWQKIEALNLPENWNAKMLEQNNPNTVVLQVEVPKNERNASFLVNVMLSGKNLVEEKAAFIVYVDDSLVQADLGNVSRESTVGEEIVYEMVLLNDSMEKHVVRIESSLPVLWFNPVEVKLEGKSSKTVELKVAPKTQGKRDFEFAVKSALNEKTIKQVPATITAFPSIKSKYSASFNGFPFFTPNLLPYYIINSFLSLIG